MFFYMMPCKLFNYHSEMCVLLNDYRKQAAREWIRFFQQKLHVRQSLKTTGKHVKFVQIQVPIFGVKMMIRIILFEISRLRRDKQ